MKRRYAILGLLAAITMLSSIITVSAVGEEGVLWRKTAKIFVVNFHVISPDDVTDVSNFEYIYVDPEGETETGELDVEDWYTEGNYLYVVIKPNEAPHPPPGSSTSVINIYGTYTDGFWSASGPGFRLGRGR